MFISISRSRSISVCVSISVSIVIPQTVLAVSGPGGEKRMSGGSGPCVKSSGGVSRPKMCIWRSGGPKSMGKQVVPVSPSQYFRGNIAILDIRRLPTAAGPDGLSESTKYTPDGLSESTKYTQINEKSIFLWCDCRKYTFFNEKTIFWYQMNQPIESIN